ncbi:hypothetical protein VNO77_41971 [Canavalia gladiata]|uniref:Uncharacterized protein n=1 Tax=Canavalia gladiata TaxID=3824 RepID=A0AAN9K1U1_CANGL
MSSESVAKPSRQHDLGFPACSYGPLDSSSYKLLSPKDLVESWLRLLGAVNDAHTYIDWLPRVGPDNEPCLRGVGLSPTFHYFATKFLFLMCTSRAHI